MLPKRHAKQLQTEDVQPEIRLTATGLLRPRTDEFGNVLGDHDFDGVQAFLGHSSPHAEDVDQAKRSSGWHQLGSLLPDADSPRNLVVRWLLESRDDRVPLAPVADSVLRQADLCSDLPLRVTSVGEGQDFSGEGIAASGTAIGCAGSGALLDSAADVACGAAGGAGLPAVGCACPAGLCREGNWAWCHLRGPDLAGVALHEVLGKLHLHMRRNAPAYPVMHPLDTVFFVLQ